MTQTPRTAVAGLVTLGLILAFVAASTSFSAAQKPDRPGINDEEYSQLVFDFISVLPNTFDVQGTNPDGSQYSGSAYLYWDPQDGELTIEWQIGSQSYEGRGPLIGGEFIIEWGDSSPAIYTVQRSGDLFGTWSNGTATEVLQFAP